jgi:hypothetical protein
VKSKKRFSRTVLNQIGECKILGIRAGTVPHRFIGIWMVVVEGRVFARSWNDKPNGWYRAFLKDPRGAIQIPGREIAVHVKKTRGERLLDRIDVEYGKKYHTPGSRVYVRGLALPRRRNTTLELIPG